MRFQSLQEEILWFTFKSSIFVRKNMKHPLFMDVLSSEAPDCSCKVRDICLNFKSFPGIDLTLRLLSPQSLWQRFLLQPHYMPHFFGSCYCDSDAGRVCGQEEKGTTEDEMAGWHHWLDGRESEWTPGVGDGQGGLACCDSWGLKESDTTERLNWLNWLWVCDLWQSKYSDTVPLNIMKKLYFTKFSQSNQQ